MYYNKNWDQVFSIQELLLHYSNWLIDIEINILLAYIQISIKLEITKTNTRQTFFHFLWLKARATGPQEMSFSLLHYICSHRKLAHSGSLFHLNSYKQKKISLFYLKPQTVQLFLAAMPKSAMRNPQQTSGPNISGAYYYLPYSTIILFLSHVIIALFNCTVLLAMARTRPRHACWSIANSTKAFFHGTSVVESQGDSPRP